MHKADKQITRRFNVKTDNVRYVGCEILTDRDNIKCVDLYKSNDSSSEVQNNDKNWKSPGIHEFRQNYENVLAIQVQKYLCCLIWKSQKWPKDCIRSFFITIPKKEDPA